MITLYFILLSIYLCLVFLRLPIGWMLTEWFDYPVYKSAFRKPFEWRLKSCFIKQEYEEEVNDSKNAYDNELGEFKTEFQAFLFDNHYCISSFLENKNDPGFCRVVDTWVNWYGTTIWSKSDFKQIFEELQTMRFKPFKGEINSFEC